MIIECTNCNKKFEINEELIPDKGRLLQCGSCNHEWFFKNEVSHEFKTQSKNENLEIFEKNIHKQKEDKKSHQNIDSEDNIRINKEENVGEIVLNNNNEGENYEVVIRSPENKKRYSISSLIIVFLISFVALIILIDTFKSPLGKIVPNIEFLLYNFYESFRDITLFIRDLI